MKKKSSSTGSDKSRAPTGGKTGSRRGKKKDPFSNPPNPLGYNYLEERARINATQFSSIIPSVIARYGIGRKLGVERFLEAWNATLEAVFGDDDFVAYDDFDEAVPSRLETIRRHSRLASFRGGVLRIEVVSSLLAGELHFQAPQLLKELRKRLPYENLDQIKFVVR
ncbi:MAG: DUF721 domain-containing protein [Thermoguttaceae bacterium]|jgi:hypothetical protein